MVGYRLTGSWLSLGRAGGGGGGEVREGGTVEIQGHGGVVLDQACADEHTPNKRLSMEFDFPDAPSSTDDRWSTAGTGNRRWMGRVDLDRATLGRGKRRCCVRRFGKHVRQDLFRCSRGAASAGLGRVLLGDPDCWDSKHHHNNSHLLEIWTGV